MTGWLLFAGYVLVAVAAYTWMITHAIPDPVDRAVQEDREVEWLDSIYELPCWDPETNV